MSSNIQSKFMNRLFRRIEGAVWDLTTGTQGLRVGDSIYSFSITPGGTLTTASADGTTPAVVTQVEASGQISVNPFGDLGSPLPAFAVQVPLEQVNPGDLIVGDKAIIGWVVSKTGAAVKVMDHNGHHKTYTPPKVAILGGSGLLVVQNLFNMTGGADGANAFAGSLLPLMLMTQGQGGGSSKLEKMLPFLLSGALGGGATGGAGGMNPMMLLAMTGGLGGKSSGGGIDPMMLLAMTGGLGGGSGGGLGGMNPMMLMALMDGDLFGSATFGDDDTSSVPPLRPARPPLRPSRD